ncbi:MAG: MarR family transcriptional regulator [Rhodobacteraceae bacterium]|nr:MarR family transcriptional regulator [Paracoccaceae bacterium]
MNDSGTSQANEHLLYLTDEQLRQGIEALTFAYRKLARAADPALARHGYGRAHYRAILMIGIKPYMTITELMTALGVSKQSVDRVLLRLKDNNVVKIRHDDEDRRVRRLSLTDAGERLAEELLVSQRRMLRKAYLQTGAVAVTGFRTVAEQLMEPSIGYQSAENLHNDRS